MADEVAVVGAGMAGLACAGALREAGLHPVLFDKGRSAGGRVSTRRRDGLMFNHGAQYATARTEPFRAVLSALREAGSAAVWAGAGGHDARWTGVPGMSALPRALSAGLDVRTERHVLFLRHDLAGWWVRHIAAAEVRPGTVDDAGGELAGPFGAVAVALPPPQAAPLLRAAGHGFAGPVAGVAVDPCWAVMFATDTRLDVPGFETTDLVRWSTPEGDGSIGTAARDSARPGHPEGPECWMLHAAPAWSRTHEEDGAADVAAILLAEFSRRAGAPVAATHLHAHRWRHSQTRTPLGQRFLWDAAAGLGVCGDWCLGARVEDAFTSGRGLAEAISARSSPA